MEQLRLLRRITKKWHISKSTNIEALCAAPPEAFAHSPVAPPNKEEKKSGAGPPQCHGTGGRGQQPAPPQGASDKTSGSISTSMPSSAPPGIPPEPPAAHGPAIVPSLPKCHGTGGRGQQPAPPQGASDKTSGSIPTSMPSSASPDISPEPPAVRGSLPGDDETARLPSSPLAASKRTAGALSPIDVALFPTSPCTAECCYKHKHALIGFTPTPTHPSALHTRTRPYLPPRP